MKNDDDQYVTKKELREELATFGDKLAAKIKRKIIEEMSEVLADMMTNIGMHFQKLEQKTDANTAAIIKVQADIKELKADNKEITYRLKNVEASQARTEKNQIATNKLVDQHSIQIARLHAQAA